MAKITQVKLFESSSLDQETAQKIAPLIDFINSGMDQIITALDGKLTFKDNIDAELVTLKVKHGTKKDVLIRNPERLIGLLVYRVLHASDTCSGLHWQLNTSGTLAVTPYFRNATSDDRNIILLAQYS